MTKQELRDRQGRLIGKIESNGSKETIRDAQGRHLGTFDGKQTRDAQGRLVGNGNLLTTLLIGGK